MRQSALNNDMTTIAALQVALALLPLIQTGITEFVNWINSLKKSIEQDGEWTPELDASWRASLLAKGLDPAYQPDQA